jgi:hypothetical protein
MCVIMNYEECELETVQLYVSPTWRRIGAGRP